MSAQLMAEALARRSPTPGPADDQAAGLRRLFAPAVPRLLPVLAGGAGSGEGPWLARLGEAFARGGQRTLLVDGSRTQVASVFGLRARFDLQHAIDGDCALSAVQLDAAQGLTVVPAARACEQATAAGIGLSTLLRPFLDADLNIVLLLLPANCARLLPAGDVLVPVLPTRESVAVAAAQIGEAASRQGLLAFRLLFLGMQAEAAVTLGERMRDSLSRRLNTTLRLGAVAPLPRDLGGVVAAASGITLAQLEPATRRTGSGDER